MGEGLLFSDFLTPFERVLVKTKESRSFPLSAAERGLGGEESLGSKVPFKNWECDFKSRPQYIHRKVAAPRNICRRKGILFL